MDIKCFDCQGDRETMQDCYFAAARLRQGVVFGGVFDGHGQIGWEIADLVKTHIYRYIESYMCCCSIKENKEILKTAYDLASKGTFSTHSGTTALCFILKGSEKLTVANTGDSRLVVFSGGKIAQVTRDHNIFNEKEVERIRRSGGIVSGNCVKFEGEKLMCTRSFGDTHFNKAGVIYSPEIFEQEIKSGDFIIAGTDGLWNELSNADVAEIVSGKSNANEAVEALKEVIRAIGEDNDNMDNITFIVIKV